MQVERMRLATGAAWRGHPTREQQVLHYQWFADLGSAEAQRALGQMLTQGVQRDPEQAFRYFRSAHCRPPACAEHTQGDVCSMGEGVTLKNVRGMNMCMQSEYSLGGAQCPANASLTSGPFMPSSLLDKGRRNAAHRVILAHSNPKASSLQILGILAATQSSSSWTCILCTGHSGCIVGPDGCSCPCHTQASGGGGRCGRDGTPGPHVRQRRGCSGQQRIRARVV